MDQKDTLVDLFKRLGIACESTRKTSSFSFCCFCDFGREALHLLKLSCFFFLFQHYVPDARERDDTTTTTNVNTIICGICFTRRIRIDQGKGKSVLRARVEGWVDVCWTLFYLFPRFALLPLPLSCSWQCCHRSDMKHELSFCSVLLPKFNVFHDMKLYRFHPLSVDPSSQYSHFCLEGPVHVD
jgi:hypothetical protein